MTVLLAWLLADFISGIVHWWEDRALVGASRFKFLNDVRSDNERHHKMPGYLLRYSWWGNINTTAPIAWALAILLYLVGAPHLFVYTFSFIGLGNLIHRWAHEHPKKLQFWIVFLQKTGLFISPAHHEQHHYDDSKRLSRQDSHRRYCVMTSWLNPALDRIHFWQFLERFFKRG